tara:strand:+ start:35 stop:172 length:138 start_codon:yes stop_codon:yes gene_type:complete
MSGVAALQPVNAVATMKERNARLVVRDMSVSRCCFAAGTFAKSGA